jgi:hypothetical protein
MNMQLRVLFLAGIAAIGCSSSGAASPDAAGTRGEHASSFQVQLDEAATRWAKDKLGCSTYHYKRSSYSFTGSNSETSFEITADRPSRRTYVGHNVQDDGGVQTVQWDETGAAVGSHDDAYAAETVEQLFADCRTAIAMNPTENDVRLMIGVHGVPIACIYIPKNCADDCVMGASIEDFGCGPLAGVDGGQ